MKFLLLALLFVSACAVQGLKEEEFELDAEFEAENPNGDNELDAIEDEAFEKTVEQRDADPGVCSFCKLCKVYKYARRVRNRYANYVCKKCKYCNPMFYVRLLKRLPYRKMLRRLTKWGRRRRRW